MRSLVAVSFLFLLAACADQGAHATASSSDSAPLGTDLGGSSRIPRIAALAGEGEGYGRVPAAAPAGQSSTPTMDHSAMGHGSMSGMSQSSSGNAQIAQAASVQGTGTVKSVDAAGHKVNLSHDPIPAIGWPAMTMDFAVAPAVDLGALRPGTRVTFMMRRGGDGMYVIQSITPAGGQR